MTTTDEQTANIHLTLDQIKCVIVTLSGDMQAICNDVGIRTDLLSTSHHFTTDRVDRDIEELIKVSEELAEVAQIVKSLHEGRKFLQNNDRETRTKIATRVKEAQVGGQIVD